MASKVMVVLLALALLESVSWASGAPWYRWKNVVTKVMMCAQITPGDVWAKYDGPYMDSRCKKPGNPQ